MRKLDALIAELCPNGVEYKKIRDVYTRLKGTPITAGKMKEIDNPDGDIRIFAGGKTVINAFEKDIPKANITRVPAVLVQSRGVIDFIFYEEPFTFKNEMWAYTNEERTSVKFLYYVLKNNTNYFREAASGMGSLPQISLRVTEEFKIPVPPIEVQREIVRILDNFTELTTALTAELTARKKQYEYYRNKMLTFEVPVRTLKVQELCEISRGKVISKKDIKENPGIYPVYSSQTENDGELGRISSYTYDGEYLTWTTDGANAGTVFYRTGKFNITNVCGLLKVNTQIANTRYLFHALSIEAPKHVSRGMGNPKLMSNVMGSIKVSVPDISIQNRIVNVLDNFDALCSDLNIGLPVEIEARQKQYEYYRDFLLTFAESGNRILTDRQTDR
ncbi:MAG: restriction endonuclease subunit S, partial [Eubacteriaceae bacterium]|nr:restriction endonuclease subunit S [Eubacteriaceae bacterium]